MPPPVPPMVKLGRRIDGIADAFGEREPVAYVADELRMRRFEADLPHRVFEQQPVFGFFDGVDLRADQLNAVFLEHARFGQLHREIQRGLSADGREQRVRPFAPDDLLDVRRGERLDIGVVGKLRVGHDGGRIGVDQDHFVAVGWRALAACVPE